MEFSETQIAGLILGYLKTKHYMSTFNKFLDECRHFEKLKQHIRSGDHYPTRVGGMSLVEFLEEYANLYTIVQARLEDTDYFNGTERRSSLGIIDQLLYLLNTKTVHVSTPASSICSSEVEATSYDALPGNSQDTDSNHLKHKITPKRKFLKTHSRSFNDNIDPAEVSEVLSQHLLDKTEFHVKLANTINTIRNSPEVINRQQPPPPPPQEQHQEQPQQQQQQQPQSYEQVGASKELEVLIKSVVEKTEEDPIYNQLIDEIMGIPTTDSTSSHKITSISDSNTDDQWDIRRKQRLKLLNYSEIIETQNDDAIRGIIAASSSSTSLSSSLSQSLETPETATVITAVAAATTTTTTSNSGIYIYDGNLDYYLKNNAAATMLNQNQFFIGTPGILVVPQISQCDTINTEQSQNNKTLTDNDIMAMPTIIINDEEAPPDTTTSVSIVPLESHQDQENKHEIKTMPTKTKSEIVQLKNRKSPIETIVNNTDKAVETIRSNNTPHHVRNLDFSTPSKLIEIPSSSTITSVQPDVSTEITTTTTTTTSSTISTNTITKTALSRAWDADLRLMIYGENGAKIEGSPPRKKRTRKKCNSRNTKETDKNLDKDENVDEDNNKDLDDKNKDLAEKPVTPTNEHQQIEDVIVLDTPTKDCIPKTPGVTESLTPFSQVIEEQLHGIDIMSFPTPKVPVTPGFGITTPLDANYKQRGTDYSTSSSYYIPSDNEQNNKSIEQAIEEAKKPTTKVNIISDLVIDKQTTTTTTKEIVTTTTTTTQSCSQTLEEFNRSVVGRKDLKLMKLSDVSSCSLSSSSSASSSSDNEHDDKDNNTVLYNKSKESKVEKSGEEIISDIIKKVEVQATLPGDKQVENDQQQSAKKQILKNLEEKRRRTIERMQKPIEKKTTTRTVTKLKPQILPTRKRLTKKHDPNVIKHDDNKNKTKQPFVVNIDDDRNNKNGSVDDEDEAKKLVQGLWERGICLVPKKTQIKPLPQSNQIKAVEPLQQQTVETSSFQRYCCSEMIEIIHQDGFVAKKLNHYDLKRLEKKMEASVYIDDDDTPVTRNMECIRFVQLLDIPSIQKRGRRNLNVGKSTSLVSPVKSGRILSPEEDKLMDYVAIGKITGVSPELKTKTPRKRKLKPTDTNNEKGTEKKSRKHENSIKLLRDINVDDFLDKVHNA